MNEFDASQAFTPCEITARQKQEWSDTRVALMYSCPGFAHIFYTMLNNNNGNHIALFTKDVPTLATDSVNIMVNPDYFFPLPIKQRVFALVHEIMHAILNHIVQSHQIQKQGHIPYPDGLKLSYIPMLGNISQDYCINAILVNARVGEVRQGWLYDTNIATHQSQWADVYRRLYEELDKRGGIQRGYLADGSSKYEDLNNGGKPVIQGEQFDDHLAPGKSQGKDPDQAAKEHSPAQWTNAIAAAAALEAKRGDDESPLTRMFQSMLTPKVSWQDYIAGLFARKVGSGGYNFRRMDKRLIARDIYVPERSGQGVGLVVLVIDHSGSITAHQVGEFLGEGVGIFDSAGARKVIVIWCDMKISRIDELDDVNELNDLVKHMPPPGGTDFRPPFKWVDEEGITPDAMVYLTDGEGRFPDKAPAYPVIWGSIKKTSTYPFGDVVDLTDLK